MITIITRIPVYAFLFGILAWSSDVYASAAGGEFSLHKTQELQETSQDDASLRVVVWHVGHGNCITVHFPKHSWKRSPGDMIEVEVPEQTLIIDCGTKSFRKNIRETEQSEKTPANLLGKSVSRLGKSTLPVPFSLEDSTMHKDADIRQQDFMLDSSDDQHQDLSYDPKKDGQNTPSLGVDLRSDLVGKIRQALSRNGGMNALKTVVITHPDQDHYSLIPDVLSGWQDSRIENIVLGGSVQKYVESFLLAGMWGWFEHIYATEFTNTAGHAQKNHPQHLLPIQNVWDHFKNKKEEIEELGLRLAPARFGPPAFPEKLFGKAFDFGGRFKVEVLAMNAGHVTAMNEPARFTIKMRGSQGTDENANSIILKITDRMSNKSILFTGDATGLTTTRLMDVLQYSHQEHILQSDILIAAHHGSFSHGSNNAAWIQSVRPQFIIVSGESGDREYWQQAYKNFVHPGIAQTDPHRLSPHQDQETVREGIFTTAAHGNITIVFPGNLEGAIRIHAAHSGTGVFEAKSQETLVEEEKMHIDNRGKDAIEMVPGSQGSVISLGKMDEESAWKESPPLKKSKQ